MIASRRQRSDSDTTGQLIFEAISSKDPAKRLGEFIQVDSPHYLELKKTANRILRRRGEKRVEVEEVVTQIVVFILTGNLANTLTAADYAYGHVTNKMKFQITDGYRHRSRVEGREVAASCIVADDDTHNVLDSKLHFDGNDKRLEDAEAVELVYRYLKEETPENEALFIARALDGESFHDLEQRMHVPQSALRARCRRIAARLKTKLETHGY
ncbi:MAG: hypothetical protein KDB23_02415 [Planctomycetales bacterium]|nr:hypothetical protein [Planctomycetales bacterium]